METTSDSPDRYVNWYEKTALLFLAMEKEHGQKRLNQFLSDIYRKFKGTRKATTSEFYAIATRHFQANEFKLMKGFLSSKGWSGEQLKKLAAIGGFSRQL